MKTVWKNIPNYENYKISTTGKIKNINTGRILKFSLRKGYLSCNLSSNNIKKTYNIHQLVAKIFIKNPKRKRLVNHIDGNKLNNNIDNLEWVSPSENCLHAHKNNLVKSYKRKVNQCDKFGNIIMTYDSIKNAEKHTGVNSKHISSVCLGKRKTSGGYIWKFYDDNKSHIKEGKPLSTNKNYLVTKDGKVYSCRSNKFLKPKIDPDGYLSVSICDNGKKKQESIHRLVARVYLKNKCNYKYVNHIDLNKQNNNLNNLEWCSPKENMIHYAKNGKNIFRVKVIQLTIDKKIIKKYNSVKEASIKTKVDKSSIVRVCKGKQKQAGNYIWSYNN